MNNTIRIGTKFTLSQDWEVKGEVIKQGTLSEVIEIDETDSDMPYKVEFEGYEYGWEWMSKQEILDELTN